MARTPKTVLLPALVLAAAACAAPEPDVAPPVVLTDLDGRAVEPLAGLDARATVFLFTRTDCPISNRYAPVVREIHERFAPRGVDFWLVYLDRNEPSEAIRGHLAEYDYPLPALRDDGHALVGRTGASVTPEAAVFSTDGELRYRGRIDDRYVDFGKARAEPSSHDLVEALEAMLAGRPVEVSETRAVGCFIPDLKPDGS